MHKHLIGIAGTIVTAVGIVVLLAWDTLAPLKGDIGFNREFLPNHVALLHSMENTDHITDLAGYKSQTLYFKTKIPSTIVSTDNDLKNLKYIKLNIPADKKLASLFYTFIDSASVKILSGRLPGMIVAEPGLLSRLFDFPSKLFTRVVQISNNSFVYRGFDSTSKSDQIFFKGNPITEEIVREKNISEKNKDAGISTDGELFYDKKENKVMYVHYYRNEFLCLDTNLNLIYKSEIIRNLSQDLLIAGTVSSKNVKTSGPSRTVNNTSAVSTGYLYINSGIKSDNETDEDFRSSSAIDVYNIQSGTYVGSFYIPMYKNERFTRFFINGDTVICIYKSNIAIYSLTSLK